MIGSIGMILIYFDKKHIISFFLKKIQAAHATRRLESVTEKKNIFLRNIKKQCIFV